MSHTPSFDPSLRVVELDEASGGVIFSAFSRIRAEHDRDRPVGLHLSTIRDDMIKTLYPQKYKGVFTEQEQQGYQELGNIVETIIASELARAYLGWVKPDPQQHMGIWCSPDGWHALSRTIDEIKLCWTSETDFLDSVKFLSYVWQALGYAYVWGAERIRIHVLFVNGKYPRGKPAPNPRTFIVRWRGNAPKDKFMQMRQHAIDRGWL